MKEREGNEVENTTPQISDWIYILGRTEVVIVS